MPNTTLLAVAGGLSIAGAAVGVTLGRSTVAEINPAYLQDAEVPFYSGLVPGGRPRADWAQVQAQEYQAQAQGQTPPPAGCVGCTWPVDPTPREDPAIATYDRMQYAQYEPAPPRERAEAPVRIMVVEQPAERDWNRVTRYANYPVRRDEASIQAEQEDHGGTDDGATGGDAVTD
jgi:hypothetical protein